MSLRKSNSPRKPRSWCAWLREAHGPWKIIGIFDSYAAATAASLTHPSASKRTDSMVLPAGRIPITGRTPPQPEMTLFPELDTRDHYVEGL
jgi:hypothetical protein